MASPDLLFATLCLFEMRHNCAGRGLIRSRASRSDPFGLR
jgi:hypothetical protein